MVASPFVRSLLSHWFLFASQLVTSKSDFPWLVTAYVHESGVQRSSLVEPRSSFHQTEVSSSCILFLRPVCLRRPESCFPRCCIRLGAHQIQSSFHRTESCSVRRCIMNNRYDTSAGTQGLRLELTQLRTKGIVEYISPCFKGSIMIDKPHRLCGLYRWTHHTMQNTSGLSSTYFLELERELRDEFKQRHRGYRGWACR